MWRVRFRSTVGVGIVLLAVHGLVAAGFLTEASATVEPDRARLRIDPNVATREELVALPRIGPVIATYIVEYRDSVHPSIAFRCAEDLTHVHRIGPRTVERLRPLLRFPSGCEGSTNGERLSP